MVPFCVDSQHFRSTTSDDRFSPRDVKTEVEPTQVWQSYSGWREFAVIATSEFVWSELLSEKRNDTVFEAFFDHLFIKDKRVTSIMRTKLLACCHGDRMPTANIFEPLVLRITWNLHKINNRYPKTFVDAK